MNPPRILELRSPDNFAGSLTIDDETRADFLNNLRANPGYIRLTKSPGFDSGRRRRLEEACWLHHCNAKRARLDSARAKRALFKLNALRQILGNTCGLPPVIDSALDLLEKSLKTWASKKKRGRPTNTLAKVFRETMYIFIPNMPSSQKSSRLLSREASDEILAELSALVFGRSVSSASFTRLRMRDRSRNRGKL
jgi:hypothetical protein